MASNKSTGTKQMSISVQIMDAQPITDAEDARRAEAACRDAITAIASPDMLALIHADHMAGLDAGIDHYERGCSAWSEVERIGADAAVSALGYRPADGVHFDVGFHSIEAK